MNKITVTKEHFLEWYSSDGRATNPLYAWKELVEATREPIVAWLNVYESCTTHHSTENEAVRNRLIGGYTVKLVEQK